MNSMILFIHPEGGLCNRIFALNATRQLCENLSIEYRIIWKNNAECACDYEDVFSSTGIAVRNIWLAKKRFRDNIKEIGISAALLSRIKSGYNANYLREFDYRFYLVNDKEYDSQTMINKLRGFTHDEKLLICACFQYYGNKSEINPSIFRKDLISRAYQRRIKYRNYIALHIRRTDHVKCMKDNPLEMYYEIIEKEIYNNPFIKIYVATDDTKVYEDILDKYPQNVIANDIERDRLTLKGIQDAVCELLIVSGAERIYESRGSTFSEVAKILHSIENNA